MRRWIGVKIAQQCVLEGGGCWCWLLRGRHISYALLRFNFVNVIEERDSTANVARVEIVLSMATAMYAMADSFTFRPDHDYRGAVSAHDCHCFGFWIAFRDGEKGCRTPQRKFRMRNLVSNRSRRFIYFNSVNFVIIFYVIGDLCGKSYSNSPYTEKNFSIYLYKIFYLSLLL